MQRPEHRALRVGIDARSLRHGPAGIRTYVRNLLERIPILDPVDTPVPANNLLWNTLRVPLLARQRGWRLYHAPAYTAPLLHSVPVVLSVHDVSYLVQRDWYPYALDPLRKVYYRASLRRADRIVVPSDFSGREIVRLFPRLERRIRRVYLGVAPDFRPDLEQARRARQELGLPEEFLLHVGDIHPRRNIPEAAEAARILRRPLILVGKNLQPAEPLPPSTRLLSDLTLEQLRGVYCAAEVFVYASLYEGFGLPVLEAMACGLPVVATNRSCLPELFGGAAHLVEPKAADLAEGVRHVLARRLEFVRRGRERASAFGWDRTAEETVSVYRELLE